MGCDVTIKVGHDHFLQAVSARSLPENANDEVSFICWGMTRPSTSVKSASPEIALFLINLRVIRWDRPVQQCRTVNHHPLGDDAVDLFNRFNRYPWVVLQHQHIGAAALADQCATGNGNGPGQGGQAKTQTGEAVEGVMFGEVHVILPCVGEAKKGI